MALPEQIDANPVRILPFPANRIAQINPANHRIAVIYRGQVRTYDDPDHLQQAMFPPRSLVTGDQVAVIHAGRTDIYDSPEAFKAELERVRDRAAQAARDARYARRFNIGWQIVAFGVGILFCTALMGLPA